MVLMKNTAKARAPAGVCRVASTGITGGLSPGLVLGPLVGTSGGTLGGAGAVAIGADELGSPGGGLLVPAAVVSARRVAALGACALVQPSSSAQSASTGIRRTRHMIAANRAVGKWLSAAVHAAFS
jgi:hypothetical protein